MSAVWTQRSGADWVSPTTAGEARISRHGGYGFAVTIVADDYDAVTNRDAFVDLGEHRTLAEAKAAVAAWDCECKRCGAVALDKTRPCNWCGTAFEVTA